MRYFLRTRMDDKSGWSEPTEFWSRKARDKAASFARIIGGIRTHSYEEKGKRHDEAQVVTD